jgi:hypothetical protein
MIHHIQNLENRLNNINTTNTTEDDYLSQLEQEAYLNGNIVLRNWEDSIKNNTVMGGKKRKTKKNKKQKGGFKYSNKAKRTPFSVSRSTLSNRKSSRSPRNTTSKR